MSELETGPAVPARLENASESDASPASEVQRPLRSNRDFVAVVVGQGVSAMGDAVNHTALPLLVIFLTGSGVQMGIVGILQSLPDLFLSLPAGALADRWDRRRMMLYADLGRAVLTALVPLSVALGWPTMVVVLLVTAPINALRVVFLAAFGAALPNLVTREQLPRANSYMEALTSIGYILGPGIAGILAGTIGPAPTLALDAASFAFSAVTLTLVHRRLKPTEAPSGRMTSQIAEAIRFIWGHETLRVAIVLWSSFTVLAGPLVPVAVFYLSVDRGLDPSIAGVALSAFSVGFLVGSLAAGRISNRRTGAAMLVAAVANGSLLIVFGLAAPLPVMLAAVGLAGVTEGIALVAYITLRATVTPNHLLGRVGGAARTLSLGLQPLGMLTAGVLLDVVRGSTTLVLMGAGLVVAALVLSLSRPLRRARISDAVATPGGGP